MTDTELEVRIKIEPENTVIPKRYINFAKQVTKLATAQGLEKITLVIYPGFFEKSRDEPWNNPVELYWEQGRHGADSWKFMLKSTVAVHCCLENEK